MLVTSAEKFWLLSSAILRSAKLAQAGEDTAPNKWSDIWYSFSAQDKSPFGHHRKRRKERSVSGTFTWWNIASMSTMTAICSCRNLVRTPKREFVRPGPFNNKSLSDFPLYLAEQSNTTQIFPGLRGWYTPWWGMNHVFPTKLDYFWYWGTLRAYPFVTSSSTKVVWSLSNAGLFSSFFFNQLARCSEYGCLELGTLNLWRVGQFHSVHLSM